MLPEHVVDKLKYFNSSKYIVENGKVELKEKKKEGKVHLICKLKNCTLIFNDPEKNTLPYLDENIKYAKSCPDKFLFELDLDDKWILHVMEFKKTINTSTIAKSKRQFVMGIYNARALAAFLNIEIKEVRIYLAYRKDEIEGKSLIQMRSANCDPEALCIMKDWNDGICNLNIDLNKIKFEHNKIKLNQYGNGMCEL